MRIAILDDFQFAALTSPDWRLLPSSVEVVPFSDHIREEDLLIRRLEEFDAVCRIRERTAFPARVLERLPRLRLLLATGMRNEDSIDLPAARRLGITVCYTGGPTNPAVELCWALILSLFRGVHIEHTSLRAGGWQVGIGTALEGKVLGILGLGRHGSRVARIGQAFGMEAIAWSPNLTLERAAAGSARLVSKQDLFSTADIVSVHMPLSERSRGLVGAGELALMRPDAFLVNVSRGPIIDEGPLIEALRLGRIAGLGVDVFDEEPLPRMHPFRFLPNVIATPHIGYVVREFYAQIFAETVENILAFMNGTPIREIRIQSCGDESARGW